MFSLCCAYRHISCQANFEYEYNVAESKADIVASIAIRLLREKREKAALSMNVVAQRSKMSHTMISRVERGLRRPTLDTLLRIADAIKIELWPLIKKAEKTFEQAQKAKK